jgi:hypothetical protein
MQDDLQPIKAERLLRALAQVTPPAAMNARLLQRLRSEERSQASAARKKSWRWSAFGLACAALALLAFIAVPHWRPSRMHGGSQLAAARTIASGAQSGLRDYGAANKTVPQAGVSAVSGPARPHGLASRPHVVAPGDILLPDRRVAADPQRAAETQAGPAGDPSFADASATVASVNQAEMPGQTLPRLANRYAPGERLPKITGTGTPGRPLPELPQIALGERLPGFAESTQNGEQP